MAGRKPKGGKDETPVYSVSALTCYEACPYQYFSQFVLKLPPPVTPAMRRGTSVHSLIKKHFSQPSLVLEELDEDVRQAFDRFLQSRFNTPPVGAEMPFRFPVRGGDVRGRIDTLLSTDGRLEVVDFKSGSAPLQDDVGGRLQLPVYAAAVARRYEVPPSQVDYTYFFLRDGVEFHFPLTEDGERFTIERVERLIAGIQKGEFTPRAGCDCYACRRRTGRPSSARRSPG